MSEEKKKRGPSYDREYLVGKVSMMRIKGKSTYFILDFLMEKVGMSRKVAYEVLGDAQKLIIEMQKSDIEISIAEAMARLEELYENADGKLKLEVQKEINKLKGLYSAEKIDITLDFKARFPGL